MSDFTPVPFDTLLNLEAFVKEMVDNQASFYENLRLDFHRYGDFLRNQREVDASGNPNPRRWINEQEEALAKQLDSVWIFEFNSIVSDTWWMASDLTTLLTFVQSLNIPPN